MPGYFCTQNAEKLTQFCHRAWLESKYSKQTLKKKKEKNNMKKSVWILALALTLALPALGLAAEAPAAPQPLAAYGRQGGRWNQTAPQGAQAAQGSFTDADSDGVCDVCGSVPGTNAQGMRFTDADKDGVCDHLGTGQGAGFADSDGDGVCDHLGTRQHLRRGVTNQRNQGGQGMHRNAPANGQGRNRR